MALMMPFGASWRNATAAGRSRSVGVTVTTLASIPFG